MALTINDAKKLAQRPFAAAALKEISTSDEALPLIPMVPKAGDGFIYTREKSAGSFTMLADGATSVAESTGKDETITVAKRHAAEDFYIPNFAADSLSTEVDQFEAQAIKKFKVAGQTISNQIINGAYITDITVEAFAGGPGVDALVAASAYMDTNRDGLATLKYVHAGTLLSFRAPGDVAYGEAVDISGGDGNFTLYGDNPSKWITVTLDVSDFSANGERTVLFTSTSYEFDGLKKLVTPGQTRSSTGGSGDALSLGILDELIDSVKIGNGMPVFLMNAKLRRKFKDLLRAGGGVDMMELASGIKVPEYAGIPILRNDYIASNEVKTVSTLSSVYLCVLGEDEGVYMGALGGDKFDVDADPRVASLLGFRLHDLGQIQAGAGSSRGGRLTWTGGLAMGSTLSCARAKEIVTA